MLIIVSDGILEARDARGNEYGLSRLSRRIRTARGSTEDVIKAILADIDGHASDQAQADDMTIVGMSIETRRAKRKTTTLPGVPANEALTRARLTTAGGTIHDSGDNPQLPDNADAKPGVDDGD